MENLSTEVAVDLIGLVNKLKNLPKTKSVNYTSKGGTTKFSYTPLDDILEEVKNDSNFALLQPIVTGADGFGYVENVLVHKSGTILKSGQFKLALVEGGKMQDDGSVITYTRRYSLGAFLGIATEEDNDANPESPVEEKKITEKQIAMIKQIYIGDNMTKLLKLNNLENLEEMTLKKASDLIGKAKGGK